MDRGALAALALVACGSFAQGEPRSGASTPRSERLHAIVNAWLKPDANEAAADGGLTGPQLTQAIEQDAVAMLSADPLPLKPVYPARGLLLSLLETNPGPAIVEYGSCMGEATIALAAAAAEKKYTNTKVFALDSFDDNTCFEGLFMQSRTWSPPEAIAKAALPNNPAFYQFIAKTRAVRDQIVTIPLLNAGSLARAHAFGASGKPGERAGDNRPGLIFVSPPSNGTSLRHDLSALWRLLACGGTMVGMGYHLSTVMPEVDSFDENMRSRHSAPEKVPVLEKFTVHAPGTKWEALEAFTPEVMTRNKHSEMSGWRYRAKSCSAPAPAEGASL